MRYSKLLTLPAVLFVSAMFTSLAVAQNHNAPPAARQEAEPSRKKEARPKITISKETTFVTDHVTKDGYVDFLAALNAHYGKGVTPENNAVIQLLEASAASYERWPLPDELFKRLGIKPLPADGDCFADINVYIKEVAKQSNPPQDWLELYKKVEPKWRRAMRMPWQAKDAPLVEQWLRKNEKPLDLAVNAVQLARYFRPSLGEDRDLLVFQLLPEISAHRAIARALSTRTMLRLGSGDLEGAWNDTLAIHRLARLVCQGPSLLEGSIGMAIDDIATRNAWVLAQHDTLTAEQALRMQKQIAALPPINVVAEALQYSQRFVFLDLVQSLAKSQGRDFDNMRVARRLATELSEHDWMIKNEAAVKKIAMLSNFRWDDAMRRGNTRFDQLVAAVREPSYKKREVALDKIYAEADESAKIAVRIREIAETFPMGVKQPDQWVADHLVNGLVHVFLGRFNAYLDLETRSHNYSKATKLAFALAAYRSDHGGYPKKLEALAPKYIAKIPTDPLGDVVNYEAGDDGYSFTIIDPAERYDVIVSTPND